MKEIFLIFLKYYGRNVQNIVLVGLYSRNLQRVKLILIYKIYPSPFVDGHHGVIKIIVDIYEMFSAKKKKKNQL